MSEHLRYLAGHSPIPLSCMPNAGLPVLTADGARYPLDPAGLADAHETFTSEFGLSLVGGCCGTTPEHMAAVVDRVLRDPASSTFHPACRNAAPRASATADSGTRADATARAPGYECSGSFMASVSGASM